MRQCYESVDFKGNIWMLKTTLMNEFLQDWGHSDMRGRVFLPLKIRRQHKKIKTSVCFQFDWLFLYFIYILGIDNAYYISPDIPRKWKALDVQLPSLSTIFLSKQGSCIEITTLCLCFIICYHGDITTHTEWYFHCIQSNRKRMLIKMGAQIS